MKKYNYLLSLVFLLPLAVIAQEEADNTEEINKATEELTNAFHVLAQKMYQDAGAQAGEANPGEQAEEPKDDNVVDADYEVVDDDK